MAIGRYDDHMLIVEGKPVPRIGRDGLTICGWCGSRVAQHHTAPDAPWLCDDCGISRRVHRNLYGPTHNKALKDLAALSLR